MGRFLAVSVILAIVTKKSQDAEVVVQSPDDFGC
jgi:hypothetical protein